MSPDCDYLRKWVALFKLRRHQGDKLHWVDRTWTINRGLSKLGVTGCPVRFPGLFCSLHAFAVMICISPQHWKPARTEHRALCCSAGWNDSECLWTCRCWGEKGLCRSLNYLWKQCPSREQVCHLEAWSPLSPPITGCDRYMTVSGLHSKKNYHSSLLEVKLHLKTVSHLRTWGALIIADKHTHTSPYSLYSPSISHSFFTFDSSSSLLL